MQISLILLMKVWEVAGFRAAYLYQSPLKCATFPGINAACHDAANGPVFTLPQRIFHSFEKVSRVFRRRPRRLPFAFQIDSKLPAKWSVAGALPICLHPSLRIQAEGGFAQACLPQVFKETGQSGV